MWVRFKTISAVIGCFCVEFWESLENWELRSIYNFFQNLLCAEAWSCPWGWKQPLPEGEHNFKQNKLWDRSIIFFVTVILPKLLTIETTFFIKKKIRVVKQFFTNNLKSFHFIGKIKQFNKLIKNKEIRFFMTSENRNRNWKPSTLNNSNKVQITSLLFF